MVRNDEAPTLNGATRYECLNCGNGAYYTTPPTSPCPWCGFGPDSEPEPARGDSSFYAAKKKRKKQGNKYWRKRFDDRLKAMSDELARLEGIKEECKLLARRLNAVERLAVGDNAPVDEELNSDAYQAVRARLDADYPQRPLSERMIWADCDCERCKHLPSEQRVRLATPLKDYNPPNTLYKAMLKHIFERDAKR